ncbi:DUF397 domain-containing protein [Streptomyces cyaneochromogenes]|uniref:DUF397 domain-containing protein n=1 Tax=Streptomyces cyaneochromogenes TaxID=2496836 RepID=A0A3S9M9G4_9ACTN|nr:DUF397 domain-containing protein [Streptomyces cyaneochromogenes]AZQ35862.1 DUF397 domain-containing protein [Streptomyces cyaneochromogenes]
MPELTWQKSTYSAEAANCVEIATTPTTIHIRDSKNPAGPRLALQPTAWADFVSYAAK